MNPTQRRWTPADLATLAYEFPRRPTAEVAKKLKRTKSAVANRAFKMGLTKKITPGVQWTPAMLDRLRRYFPTMFNKPLAAWLGVSQRTMIRKARELGQEKMPDFNKTREREIVQLIRDARARNGKTGGQFRPGEHRSPGTEFKPGRRESPESLAKRAASMREYWARRKEQERVEKLNKIYMLK